MSRRLSEAVLDMGGESRGQAYVAEALFAVILVSTILIAVTSSGGVVQPSITVAESQQQNALESDIRGVVEQASEDGSLRSSLLNWNSSDRRFDDYKTVQSSSGYYLAYPKDKFGNRLAAISDRHNATLAVEIVPTERPFTSYNPDLEQVEPGGTPVISGGSTSETVVVYETYMTLTASDTLRSEPVVHTSTHTPAIPTGNKTTVKEAYTTERDQVTTNGNDINEIYFPYPPKTQSYSSLDGEDVWNVYRVRVIGWF